MSAIRGAICVENSVESVKSGVCRLFEDIVAKNRLNLVDIECVLFTTTKDIDVAYPAKFVREKFALDNVAFMCMQEMDVKGSLSHCIRICVIVGSPLSQADVKHCYLDGAEGLRPDLKIE